MAARNGGFPGLDRRVQQRRATLHILVRGHPYSEQQEPVVPDWVRLQERHVAVQSDIECVD